MSKSPALILLSLLLASCAAAPAPVVAPTRSLPVQAAAAVQPAAAAPHVTVTQQTAAQASFDPLAVYRNMGAHGALIPNFTRDIELSESGYSVLVVPSDSQAKADKAAKEWAPDARPIFVGYGYWKKQFISFVRHGYYSKQKDRALMLDFAVSKLALVHKSDEAGDNYREAALVLGDALDANDYTAKTAMAIALANGYVPQRFHVAALLNLAYFGPCWVYLDDRDWTPVMLVDARTGTVVKTGPAIEAVKLLMKPFEKASPSPTPTPTASASVPPETDDEPTPTPSPSSFLHL